METDPNANAPSSPPQVSPVSPKAEFTLRPATDADLPFVFDSWRRSYGDAEFARSPDLATYIRTQRAVIEQALGTSRVTVAHDQEDERHILGWVCYRPSVVHYLFVKKPVRGWGIGTALLTHAWPDASGALFTTHNRNLSFARHRGFRVSFNPALIFE